MFSENGIAKPTRSSTKHSTKRKANPRIRPLRLNPMHPRNPGRGEFQRGFAGAFFTFSKTLACPTARLSKSLFSHRKSGNHRNGGAGLPGGAGGPRRPQVRAYFNA